MPLRELLLPVLEPSQKKTPFAAGDTWTVPSFESPTRSTVVALVRVASIGRVMDNSNLRN